MSNIQGSSQFSIIYESAIENDEDSEPPTPKRKCQEFQNIITLASKEEFNQWLASEDTWIRKEKREKDDGRIEYYRCRNQRTVSKCPATLKVEANKQSGETRVMQGGNHTEHGHSASMSHHAKQYVRQHMMVHTPSQIRDKMLREFGDSPLLRQVQNFVAYAKCKDGLNMPMTVHELKQHCEQYSIVPDNLDDGFIVYYNIRSATRVVIIWSTQKLLARQHASSNFSVDATYKLNSLNWPIIRSGFVDANARFYCTAMGISSTEDTETYTQVFQTIMGAEQYIPTTLMADAARSITAACDAIWPSTNRTTCFFYVMKNLKERFKRNPLAQFSEEVFMDVNTLSQAARVLNAHWAERFAEHPQVRDALATFVEQYIRDDANNGWFSGGDWPRTNNALESSNKQLKERATQHRRLPLREFLTMSPAEMRIWSLSPDHQTPATRPTIALEVYEAAYKLEKEGRLLIKSNDDETYLLPSKEAASEYSAENADQLERAYVHLKSEDEDVYAFESWAGYKLLRSKFHYIRISANWIELELESVITLFIEDYMYCSCYIGSRRKVCKHAVLVMCRIGLDAYPDSVTSEIVQPARKRGRPKKVKPNTALARE